MEYIFIQFLREIDNNGFTKEHERVYRRGKLIIEPQWRMSVVFDGNVKFWINHIVQDLKNNRIILCEYIDIHYREFWDKDFWENFLNKKLEEGWKKSPKSWKYYGL